MRVALKLRSLRIAVTEDASNYTSALRACDTGCNARSVARTLWRIDCLEHGCHLDFVDICTNLHVKQLSSKKSPEDYR